MHPPAWATPRRDRYRFLKMLTIPLTVVLFVGWAISSTLPGRSLIQEPLRFTKNGSFQITIFEDLHFGEGMLFLGMLEML